jgi:hypothetical protein
MKKAINMFDINQLNTGDLLLFRGKSFFPSTLIKYFTHSKYSHIGIVLRDPTYIDESLNGFYLLEAGYETFPDPVTGKCNLGVRISDLFKVINTYNGSIFWRQLHGNIDTHKIKSIYEDIKHSNYDLNIFDAFEAGKDIHISDDKLNIYLSWLLPCLFDHRRINKFVCSALVAYVYMRLGLLPTDIEWSRCEPGTFSYIENPNLKLIDAFLSKEIQIYS